MAASKPKTVDDYINAAPAAAQPRLREMRALLRKVAPKATEALKWGSPVFEENRILFAYAAFKSHISFMPTPSAMEPFADDLAKHSTTKGSIQFPYNEPLPKPLIRKIAAYRAKDVRDNDARWM